MRGVGCRFEMTEVAWGGTRTVGWHRLHLLALPNQQDDREQADGERQNKLIDLHRRTDEGARSLLFKLQAGLGFGLG